MKKYSIYERGGGWYTGMENNDVLPAEYLGVGYGETFAEACLDWKKKWEENNPDQHFENIFGTLRIEDDGTVTLWGTLLCETEEEATKNGKYPLKICMY